MSKTDDTSKLDHAKLKNGVLADSELDAVTGGKLLETALYRVPEILTLGDSGCAQV